MSFTRNLLPVDVVQPFDLRYVCDDLHVMAFFENHPVYAAVEAMIRRSSTGLPVVRAILTRHDQTQVDHVNDDRLALHARSSQRETCFRQVSVLEETIGPCPRVKVEFVSHAGEPVTLDVTAASPPDAARGGLSDPGRHAATSSLPIMWRGKSALAGEASRVAIAGVNFPVPVKFRAGPHFVAHHGYFTESHHMAILRAGEVELTVVEVPATYAVGAGWTYSTVEGERRYRIVGLAPDGDVRIERVGGVAETVRGRLVSGRLQLLEVQVQARVHGAGQVTLALDPGGQFTIGLDGNAGVVAGEAAVDGAGCLLLQPTLPAWATDRQVLVRATRQQQRIVLSTVIGTDTRDAAGSPAA